MSNCKADMQLEKQRREGSHGAIGAALASDNAPHLDLLMVDKTNFFTVQMWSIDLFKNV